MPRKKHELMTGVIALLFVCCMCVSTVYGASDNAGKDFFLVYTDNYHDGEGSALFITSDYNTTGTVEIPGIGFTTTFTASPGVMTMVNISQAAEVEGSDVIVNKGIRVTSDEEVVIYFLNPRVPVYTNDAYLALPVDILNVEYIALSYQQDVGGAPSELAIVAPYDGTVVTITPSVTTGTRTQGVPYNVTLNQFEVYSLQSDNYNEDLSGTVITASHPVAVFAGSRCVFIPPNYYACDHIVEQMTPVATWGKKFDTFPFMPHGSNPKGDFLRIIASENGTSVSINGASAGTLDRAEFMEVSVTSPTEISTSKPVMLSQYMTGEDYENANVGDPSSVLITPTEQFMSHYTFIVPIGYARNYVNIIAPTSSLSNLLLDGANVDTTLFTAFGSSGLSVGTIFLDEGSHTLVGSAPFGIYVYGYNSYVSYGYPGGLALEFINPSGDTNPPICSMTKVNSTTYVGTCTDDRPSEDTNGNGVLDAGEDLNGNGIIDKDTGVFQMELLNSTNAALSTDPFIPGAFSVDFDVDQVDPLLNGQFTLAAKDGAGNKAYLSGTFEGSSTTTTIPSAPEFASVSALLLAMLMAPSAAYLLYRARR